MNWNIGTYLELHSLDFSHELNIANFADVGERFINRDVDEFGCFLFLLLDLLL